MTNIITSTFGSTINYSERENEIKQQVGEVPKYLSDNQDYADLTEKTPYVSEHEDEPRKVTTEYDNGDKLNIEIYGGHNDIYNLHRTSLAKLIAEKDVKKFSFFDASLSKSKPKYYGEFDNIYATNGPENTTSIFDKFTVDEDADGRADRTYKYDNDNRLAFAAYDINDDGNTDYEVKYDTMHKLEYERFDTDGDGVFDVEYKYYETYYTRNGKVVESVESEEKPEENKKRSWLDKLLGR